MNLATDTHAGLSKTLFGIAVKYLLQKPIAYAECPSTAAGSNSYYKVPSNGYSNSSFLSDHLYGLAYTPNAPAIYGSKLKTSLSL